MKVNVMPDDSPLMRIIRESGGQMANTEEYSFASAGVGYDNVIPSGNM